jgi:hypothetical protein
LEIVLGVPEEECSETLQLVEADFRGAMPMGLATIITMLIYVAVPVAPGFLYFTQVLFWIDMVFSLLTCFGVPLYMYFPNSRSPALPPPSPCPLSPFLFLSPFQSLSLYDFSPFSLFNFS